MTEPLSEDGKRNRDPGKRAEIVTSTGWRIVGSAVGLVSDIAAAGLRMPDAAEVVFAATFRVRKRLAADPVAAMLASIGESLRQTWDDLQPLNRDEVVRRTAGRVNALLWDREGARGGWTGELLWRHPHPDVGGVACTTHVVIAEQPGVITLGVRVSVPGGLAAVRGVVGVAQARPKFLTDIARATQLAFEGHATSPTVLQDDDVDEFVQTELLSETREYPVAVLAPMEGGEYLIPPEELAGELIGVAPLFVLARHPTTYQLTDALGDRRLSAYWGALRVYLPGFTCADWSDAHPLLRNDVIGDPIMRAEVIGKLAVRSASRVVMPRGVDAQRDQQRTVGATQRPNAAPVAATVQPAGAAPAGNAAQALPFADVLAKLAQIETTVARLADITAALSNEMIRMRSTGAVRAAGSMSIERRLERIDELLRGQFAPPAEQAGAQPGEVDPASDREDGAGQSLVDVVREAGIAYADTLLILDAAEHSASESPYEDIDRAAIVLEAMSIVSQRRRDGLLGVSLRDAFRELGIDYRRSIAPTTSKKLRQQYFVAGPGGVEYTCEEHIVIGGSYDPRHCLRIYFTSRAPQESRFVIGHVGRHFDVATTT